MKAYISDKAKSFFNDKEASKSYRAIIREGKPLDGARVRMQSGKNVRIASSSSSFSRPSKIK